MIRWLGALVVGVGLAAAGGGGAEPTAAATEAIREPHSTGALIIPFDRARARHAARR